MQKIVFYFSKADGYEMRFCAVSDWYCKPSILRCLAFKSGALFVTCEKYGCRQFTPLFSKSYPIHFWYIEIISGVPYLTLEFSSTQFEDVWFDHVSFFNKLFHYYN